MITMSNFPNNGRLANQLFQYASLIGQAKLFNQQLLLPKWSYSEYFEAEFPEGYFETEWIHNEPVFHYGGDFGLINRHGSEKNYDLRGYYQSQLYWQDAIPEVRKALTFKKSFKKQVRKGYNFSKPVIAIHIRRGDYVGHDCYLQLPPTYFYNALQQWNDWRACNVLIFSDDIPYCKLHFECLENVQFATGNEIEDMCLASQCDRFVLSNSSYSWWAAYLSGSKEVIRPNGLFRGEYAKTHNDKDFWIESWRILEANQRINLSDVTFTIPVYFDHPDRKSNVSLAVYMIQHYIDAEIILMENKLDQFQYMERCLRYTQCNYSAFHRTRMLNDMARLTDNNIIFNWDADILISPIQIAEAVYKLRQGIEMVFPYDGRFARFDRHSWFDKIKHHSDIGILATGDFIRTEKEKKTSSGGAVGYLKDKYMSIGGENENFISFGAEDLERVSRAAKLGLQIERVKGVLYHINHWLGVHSSTRNPYFVANRMEFHKVDEMSKEQLLEYIETWQWKKQPHKVE